jgi:outer membrane lipoprotein-sorting protein
MIFGHGDAPPLAIEGQPLHTARIALGLTVLALLCSAPRAMAADPPPPAPTPALSADDKATVQKAVDYIEGLKAVEGRFTQIDPKGQVSKGTFYMQRPGKARFQYDPPAELLVVADGADVSVYDRKLKSFDQYPLAQTPLVLLLSKPFRLDHGVTILAVDRSKDGFVITAGDARRRTAGRLTLQFSQNPVALKGWTLVDAQSQKTDVKFTALKSRANLDQNLFVLKDPKSQGGKPAVSQETQAN